MSYFQCLSCGEFCHNFVLRVFCFNILTNFSFPLLSLKLQSLWLIVVLIRTLSCLCSIGSQRSLVASLSCSCNRILMAIFSQNFYFCHRSFLKFLLWLHQTGKWHHNNIIEMGTFFCHHEHLIIVTELLRQNLFKFGKFIMDNNEERYLTWLRLFYLTRQVLVSLKFVHALGLVHADVKLENIRLSCYSLPKVKLINFASSCYLTYELLIFVA